MLVASLSSSLLITPTLQIDHRWWEAPTLSARHVDYAATDAWAHLRVAQIAASLPAADAADDGGANSDDELEQPDGPPPGRDACYRHERRERPPDPALVAALNEEFDAEGLDEGDSEGEDADDDSDEDEDDESPLPTPRPPRAAADADTIHATLLAAARRQIDNYFHSQRVSPLELSSGFTREQRKALHAFIDRYGLHHRSIGIEGSSRRIVVQRWKTIDVVTAEIGTDAVGALVAKDIGVNADEEARPIVVRGRVEAFDRGSTTWTLEYTDESTEAIGIEELNVRLKRRFEYDHGADGRGEAGAQRPPADVNDGDDDDGAAAIGGAAPRVGAYDEGVVERLLAGISSDWEKKKIKYDIRHWMANWSAMVSADKSSMLFKTFMSYTSDAIFKMLPGEADRVREHMSRLGMAPEHIRRVGRRYWRRRARYACPKPEVILKGLYDVFCFFREMDDPERPGHKFFTSEAEKIFLKEIAYVQEGFLSDRPNMNMYVRVGQCKRTGFIKFRSRRSTSALEAFHLHLRAAQHPCAKGAGPMLEMARTNLFEFAWNVKAAVAANQMVNHGHFALWYVDALVDVCRGWIDVGHTGRPAVLRSWRRTDTTIKPITVRGIDWAQLKRLKEQGAQAVELSPLRTQAELDKVLAHPLLVARGDAAGIARETGIITSAKRLQKLAAGAASWARARALLEAHGVQNLQNRVRTAGHAPMEVEDPPALAPLPASRAQDAGGPLPVDHVWLPAEQAQVNIAQRDEGGDDDEGGGNGDDDEDGCGDDEGGGGDDEGGGGDDEGGGDDDEGGGGDDEGGDDEGVGGDRNQDGDDDDDDDGWRRDGRTGAWEHRDWAPLSTFGKRGDASYAKENRRRYKQRKKHDLEHKGADAVQREKARETSKRKERQDKRKEVRNQRARQANQPAAGFAGAAVAAAGAVADALLNLAGIR